MRILPHLAMSTTQTAGEARLCFPRLGGFGPAWRATASAAELAPLVCMGTPVMAMPEG